VDALGSHQLLSATAEQNQVEKRLQILNRWIVHEQTPKIACVLREQINQLQFQWTTLQKRIELESFESEPQST
jgi:hypothetical protein